MLRDETRLSTDHVEPAPSPANASSIVGEIASPAGVGPTVVAEGGKSREPGFVRSRYPALVYIQTRLGLLLLSGVVAIVAHRSLATQLSAYDGGWYLKLAAHGYPGHVLRTQSTLGFFPLYPLAIRALSLVVRSQLVAAVCIALVGGLAATVLVHRLATMWWGETTGRRATVVFALFPGSLVFSMAYSEGLTLPLVLGCLLALRSRRWVLAGMLACLAAVVEPVALVLPVVVALVALRAAWQRRSAAPLVAPVLSVIGVAAFAGFLWAWTGSPFAALIAQHDGWHNQTVPLGVLGLPLVRHLLGHPADMLGYLGTWNLWNGVLGAAFLVWSLVRIWPVRRELSPGVFAWLVGVGAVTLWSVKTLPNARMLLLAFPAVLVWARRSSQPSYRTFVSFELAAFVLMSLLTLSGHMLP
ncbi:MAG: mannosyltransferase family protein [Actinomycetota bacterium]|nr:mannosyltransferase family protein [Actinomycetota bacterium]